MKHPIITLAHEMVTRENGVGHLGAAVKLDVMRLAETRLLATASSGGGKSYALRKLLEAAHGYVQQIVIDTEGEFSSLRKEFDYVFVAKGEATEPDPRTAATLARALLELGVSAIVDIYELHPRERRKFVRIFLEALIDAPKNLWHPALIVLDEAHEYAPEQSESEALDAVIALASKGRKRDFACILATQRPAKLHKDVAAECQNKLVGLANQDIDRKRSGDELGFRSKDELLTLRALDPGEFYVLGPAFRIGDERVRDPVKVLIDQVVTPHGRKAKAWRPRKAANSKQVKAALTALAKIPKQAEQEIRDLQAAVARIRELEREARELRKGQPKEDPKALEAAYEKGKESVMKEVHRKEREARVIKNQLLMKLKELGLLIEKLPEAGEYKSETTAGPLYAGHRTLPAPTPIRAPRPQHQARSDEEGDLKIGPTERAILKFLAARAGRAFSRTQIGVQTRYSRRSSTFQAAFPKLLRAGLIHDAGNGDLVILERMLDQVREILGSDFEASTLDRPEDWLPKLQPTPRKIFEVLLEHPDTPMTREELAQRTGYSARSSTFQSAFPELEKIGLIKKAHGGIQFNGESFT
jgi:hypothetical protein